MAYWKNGDKLQLNKGAKYLCSLLDCTETTLYFDKEFGFWFTDTWYLTDLEVEEWLKENCTYLLKLKQ